MLTLVHYVHTLFLYCVVYFMYRLRVAEAAAGTIDDSDAGTVLSAIHTEASLAQPRSHPHSISDFSTWSPPSLY